jgi:hypothetical protein
MLSICLVRFGSGWPDLCRHVFACMLQDLMEGEDSDGESIASESSVDSDASESDASESEASASAGASGCSDSESGDSDSAGPSSSSQDPSGYDGGRSADEGRSPSGSRRDLPSAQGEATGGGKARRTSAHNQACNSFHSALVQLGRATEAECGDLKDFVVSDPARDYVDLYRRRYDCKHSK